MTIVFTLITREAANSLIRTIMISVSNNRVTKLWRRLYNWYRARRIPVARSTDAGHLPTLIRDLWLTHDSVSDIVVHTNKTGVHSNPYWWWSDTGRLHKRTDRGLWQRLRARMKSAHRSDPRKCE